MIFDKYDYALLKLCGICRYLPTGLLRKYDAPYLSSSVILVLQKCGLIKMQSDKQSIKLTTKGRDCLAEMGYEFPDDTRMDLKRPAYKRKLKNAFWNIALSLAGIDIYNDKARTLAGMDVGYVSSLTLRSDKNVRVLAGTRFLGILKLFDTAYIPYHIEDESAWIIPKYEREIFQSQVQAVRNVKDIRLILTGESLEELWSHIHQQGQSQNLSRGMKRFDKALEELGNEYLLVPHSCDGVIQLGFLKCTRNRERVAKAIGCDTKPLSHLPECDGVIDKTPYIIAIDFNVQRIVRALKQVELLDKNIVPKICCLSFQKSTMFKLLKLYHCQKCAIITIDKNNIYDIFNEFEKEPIKQEPYMTKGGFYIDANKRSITKADIKT